MKHFISLLLILNLTNCDWSQNDQSNKNQSDSNRNWEQILKHESSEIFFDDGKNVVENQQQLLKNYLDFIGKREDLGHPAGTASLAHQDDLLKVYRNVSEQKRQEIEFDEASYQFGVIASDVGKLNRYKNLFTAKSEKSDLFLDILTGRSDLKSAVLLRRILNGYIFSPEFSNNQIRTLFTENPVLSGFFHELPGLCDMFIAFELNLFDAGQFENIVKVNLYHNGPSAGFWKVFSFKLIPQILGKKMKHLKKLLSQGPFAFVKIDGFGSEGPGYPDSLNFEGQVHRIFDRVSQGTRGGLIKMFLEYKSSMDERLIEFVNLVVPRSIEQMNAIYSGIPRTSLSLNQVRFLENQLNVSTMYLQKLAMTLKRLVPVIKKSYVFMAVSVRSMDGVPDPKDYRPSELSDEELRLQARNYANKEEVLETPVGYRRLETASHKQLIESWVQLIEEFEQEFGNPMQFAAD